RHRHRHIQYAFRFCCPVARQCVYPSTARLSWLRLQQLRHKTGGYAKSGGTKCKKDIVGLNSRYNANYLAILHNGATTVAAAQFVEGLREARQSPLAIVARGQVLDTFCHQAVVVGMARHKGGLKGTIALDRRRCVELRRTKLR